MTGLVKVLRGAVLDLWPSTRVQALPIRVQQAILRNDETSEILVKLIQFFVFALWGLFYLLAPQPNPDTVSRVPVIISLYLVFTLVLLVIALMRRMPNWLIYVSIFVDVGLLIYLIWSFHVQYEQPASFSLKTVEVMNFFVLIGLRALRFEARYVVAAGLTAIIGWSLLVSYVVRTDPTDPMITRDYITYLTSNTVLIGAEISKLISMAMFTLILAIAVRRAHSFLTSSVEETSVAKDLSRFMAHDVATQIRQADIPIQAGEGVRREATVVNIDIRGFTRLVADMHPGDAMKLLSNYQHKIVPLIHRHNGVIDKFIGDGVMATFGASSIDEQHSANALRCIDDILAHMPQWNDLGVDQNVDLKINMAVAAGPVIFGAVGDGDRLEVTVIGATVNLSAKLEKHNKVLNTKALATAETYNLAVSQGYDGTVQQNNRRRVDAVLGDDLVPQAIVILA